MTPKIVSPAEWLTARKELLLKEKAATRASDALAAERRELPMVKVTKPYTFEGPNGPVTLLDLFDGRKQLVIYHFMLAPDREEGCSACSFVADHTPDIRHLHSRDTSYALVSRAPIDKIMAFKKRTGRDNIPWSSSFGQDFNYDFHVTIDESVRPIEYNYDDKETIVKKGDTYRLSGEQSGFSVFYAEGRDVYHTYSTYGRGAEGFLNTYYLLDITPLGRQEPDEGLWGRVDAFLHHDRYTDKTYTGTRELASA